jgi:MFS family permease
LGRVTLKPRAPHVGATAEKPATVGQAARLLMTPALVVFGLCVMLFMLGNAAMLPLASTTLTKRATAAAPLLIAACIVLPQLVVAGLSPAFGQLAERRGRRLVMLIGFMALPVRGILLAVITDPYAIVLIQILDGLAGAAIGVLVPLVASDIAGRSGHYNLSLGAIGFVIGIGAACSTTLGGWAADSFGDRTAFAGMAAIGAAAAALVWIAMPETRELVGELSEEKLDRAAAAPPSARSAAVKEPPRPHTTT